MAILPKSIFFNPSNVALSSMNLKDICNYAYMK